MLVKVPSLCEMSCYKFTDCTAGLKGNLFLNKKQPRKFPVHAKNQGNY
jgi:hypothetical protein